MAARNTRTKDDVDAHPAGHKLKTMNMAQKQFTVNNYPGEVERLANIIRRRKPVGEPIRILFVCLEGVMASNTTCSMFNQLVQELALSDIITSHSSNLFLDDVPADLKGRISFIVPKLTPSWDSTIDKNTYKLGGNPRILKETEMRGAALYDPTPYKEFMLSILREIAVSQAELPLHREVPKSNFFSKGPGRDLHYTCQPRETA